MSLHSWTQLSGHRFSAFLFWNTSSAFIQSDVSHSVVLIYCLVTTLLMCCIFLLYFLIVVLFSFTFFVSSLKLISPPIFLSSHLSLLYSIPSNEFALFIFLLFCIFFHLSLVPVFIFFLLSAFIFFPISVFILFLLLIRFTDFHYFAHRAPFQGCPSFPIHISTYH